MHNGSLSSKWMQDKFGKLNEHHVDKFFMLAKRLQWNITVWFGVLMDLVNVETTEDDSHCWISKLKTNENGRPIIG